MLVIEVQPTLAGAVGQGGDPPGVPVATTVEDDRGDAGRLRALGDEGAHLAGQGGLVALGLAQAGVHGADALASVRPTVSSTSCTWMWRELRLTTRRGRSGVPETRLRSRL